MLAKHLFGEDSIEQKIEYCNNSSQSIYLAKALIGDGDKDINTPISEAEIYRSLVNRGLSVKEIAKKHRKSPMYIRQKIKLLELPETIFFLINTGLLNETKARMLLDLKNIFSGTVLNEAHSYKHIGLEIEDWCSLFQTIIAWKYYNTSKEKLQLLLDRLKYIVLKATWSIINGNKVLERDITVGSLRKLMGIKVRNLTDEEILWLFRYHQENINRN